MKKLFLAFAVVFCFAACGPGSGFQVSSLNPDTDISPAANAQSLELYSWHNGQDWAYALFESATRVSSFADITQSNDIIIGTEALVEHLLQTPKGTRVYWNLKRIKGFSLPEQKVVEKIQTAARKQFIQLEVIAWPV